MSVRRAIVEAVLAEVNVSEFCRQHGVSNWFFYDLRRRYARHGDVVLTPLSRAPHHPAGRTPVEIEDRIVAARKELEDAGLDAGAGSIAFRLRDLPGLPSESTIWRILKARGLIVPQPAKAPKPRGGFTAERANECWALDDTSWALADGTGIKILNVLDDHSRLCVVSTAMKTCTGANTLAAMARAANDYGWPARIWSDNAKAFRHALATALAPLGVIASHTRPYHPHSNGKVERFHQTMQKWLSQQPRARTPTALQAQLDQFRTIYNTQRPHRALGHQVPFEVWTHAAKTGPADRALGTPTEISTVTVHNGTVSHGRRYQISIGSAHNHQTALVISTALACHVFIDGHLIRQLTLDPTQRRQPLHPRPGRPTTTTLTERKAPRHA